MEELYHTPAAAPADYAAYDKIWQRVSPGLDPYPEMRRSAGEPETEALLQLPGAEADPCCMGSAAKSDIEVLTGFIESEKRNGQYFSRLAAAVQDRGTAAVLRKIAESAGDHLRQLLAAYYLTMGECWQHKPMVMLSSAEGFCAALRQAYHEKACGGFNYLRAADAAGDLCLQELFRSFGQEEMAHARALLKLLSKRM